MSRVKHMFGLYRDASSLTYSSLGWTMAYTKVMEPDNPLDGEEELHRRDLSRAFLVDLRKAAHLRAEYQLALEDLARTSQIVRSHAEDDLHQDLDYQLEALLEEFTDPSRIESEISEIDAVRILEAEGGFRKYELEREDEHEAMLETAIRESDGQPNQILSTEAA